MGRKTGYYSPINRALRKLGLQSDWDKDKKDEKPKGKSLGETVGEGMKSAYSNIKPVAEKATKATKGALKKLWDELVVPKTLGESPMSDELKARREKAKKKIKKPPKENYYYAELADQLQTRNKR